MLRNIFQFERTCRKLFDWHACFPFDAFGSLVFLDLFLSFLAAHMSKKVQGLVFPSPGAVTKDNEPDRCALSSRCVRWFHQTFPQSPLGSHEIHWDPNMNRTCLTAIKAINQSCWGVFVWEKGLCWVIFFASWWFRISLPFADFCPLFCYSKGAPLWSKVRRRKQQKSSNNGPACTGCIFILFRSLWW